MQFDQVEMGLEFTTPSKKYVQISLERRRNSFTRLLQFQAAVRVLL